MRMRGVVGSLIAIVVFGFAMPDGHAELTKSIDLTLPPASILPQAMTDSRWGAFYLGPSQKVVIDPSNPVNFSRCGCELTSLSTALESMIAGSAPWFPHHQLFGGATQTIISFSPKYLDDYLNIGGNNEPVAPGWGYAGGGGTTCGVDIKPWALERVAVPLMSGDIRVTPPGIKWEAQIWDPIARKDVDKGLLAGYPSVVVRNKHANLIVGWDAASKKYLVYDPLWTPAVSENIDVMGGHGFSTAATEDQRYKDYEAAITAVLTLEPVLEQQSWLSVFDDPEPILLRITDPRGMRTGYDPMTNQILREDRSIHYGEATSFADPLGTLPEADPVRYIAVPDPLVGAYGLEVFGTGTGPFTLDVTTVNGGPEQTVMHITGTIGLGETKLYEIVRSADGSVAVTSVPAFLPRARAGNDASAFVGVALGFDGRGSYQISDAITSYAWDFGDGATASGAQQSHSYASAGTYTARLTVTNGAGLTSYDERTVLVVDPTPGMETRRVDTSTSDAEPFGGDSLEATITPDGRYVAFMSSATNLVAGDTNGLKDIFVKDLQTGVLERVSVATGGAQQTGTSGANGAEFPSISDDGRFVAFSSDASSLGAQAFSPSVFVHDRMLNVTEAISLSTTNVLGQGQRTSISADGRYVAFDTFSALDAADSNGAADVYRRDRQTSTTLRVSVTGAGGVATGGSRGSTAPKLSGDGNVVAFTSDATNLDGDTNGTYADIFVRDVSAGTTALVSRSSTSQPLAAASSTGGSMSADGRYVTFETDSANVVANDTNGYVDIFVRDRMLGTTTRASVNTLGNGADQVSAAANISANGRYVSFYSAASNLAPSGSVSFEVYLRDLQAGTTERVSVHTNGTIATSSGYTEKTGVTSAGSVVFVSTAANLVNGDTNGVIDVFVHRLASTSGTPTPFANLGGPYIGWATNDAVPAAIRFDGTGSLDPQGRTLTATWDFGDGTTVDGPLAALHAYAKPGMYTVTLTVKAASDVSAPVTTDVTVLPDLPANQIKTSGCAAAGGQLALEGAAIALNNTLVTQGWDTSHGPIPLVPLSIAMPWGAVMGTPTLPGFTFKISTTVPAAQATGDYTATLGTASSPFQIPCIDSSNLPPLANAGGPTYLAHARSAITLDGSASNDPENASLTYAWDFGDGTVGTGETPSHAFAYEGTYLVRLIVNDGVQNSADSVGTHSFALVTVDAPSSGGCCDSGSGSGEGAFIGAPLLLILRRRRRR